MATRLYAKQVIINVFAGAQVEIMIDKTIFDVRSIESLVYTEYDTAGKEIKQRTNTWCVTQLPATEK